MDSLLKFLQGIFEPSSSSPPVNHMSTDQAAQQFISQNPNWHLASSPNPTSAPTAMPTSMPTNAPFKFQMGQSDYSWVKPQLQKLLTSRSSPLAPFLDEFIKAGERYGIDPRVLPTIANNESSLGTKYPTDSFNPFGYVVNPSSGPNGVAQGLRNAAFTSLPMAIDRLTSRFARQPTANYQQFYSDPTISNLQSAYNANPAERDNYLKNGNDLVQFFQ